MQLLLTIVRIAAPFVVAYLVGGIPWSLIVGKSFYKVDLRQCGSGNLGATNAFRALGVRAGVSVLALDMLKGALAVVLAMIVVPATITGDTRDWITVGVGMVAVLGHTYSPYIKMHGGKGVATAGGAVLAAMPMVVPPLLIVFVLVVYFSRMVSLGSIMLAVLFPLMTWVFYGNSPVGQDRIAYVVFSLVAAALVLWKHRSNMVRIYYGRESRISFSGRGQALSRMVPETVAPDAGEGCAADGADNTSPDPKE